MEFHQYGEYSIPVCTGKNARAFYNMSDDEIDRLRCGTKFVNDGDCGDCMEPGGFRGTDFENVGDGRFKYLDDNEIKERCEYLKRERASIIHLFFDNNVPCKYQNGLGYCWGYGACSTVEANMLVQGDSYVELSPDSVCAPVKRGANQGGWASEFLEYAQKYGIAKQSTWKQHDTNYRKYDTPEVNAEREAFMPKEWVNIRSGDMHALRSLLAENFACGMGLMWWMHLIMFGIVDWSDKHGWLYGQRNSHGARFGYKGWLFHTESSAKHGGGSTVLLAK